MKKILGFLLLAVMLIATMAPMATAVLPSGTVHVYVKNVVGWPAANQYIKVVSDQSNHREIARTYSNSKGEAYITIPSPYVGSSVCVYAETTYFGVTNGYTHIQTLPGKTVTVTVNEKYNPSGGWG